MKANKIRLLYAGYVVLITAFFLYLQFPVRSARNYLISRLKAFNPDLKLTVAEIKPVLPPALKLEKVKISYLDIPLVEIGRLKVGPVLKSLFDPEQAYFFQADLYGGTIDGRLNLVRKASFDTAELISTLSGIRIAESAELQHLLGRSLAGTLGGEIHLAAGSRNATAALKISDGRVGIPGSVLGIKELSFKDLSADIAAQNRNLRIKGCTIRGSQVDGQVKGTIELRQPIGKSVLNLTGSFRPHDQFLAAVGKRFPLNLLPRKNAGGNFPVRFGGTIAAPELSMN